MSKNYLLMTLGFGLVAGLVGSSLVGEGVLAQEVVQTAETTKATEGISQFISGLIRILSGIAGLVATGFIVIGGLTYITSSGNPVALEKAKRTIIFAAFGLVITIAAFGLSSLVAELGQKSFTP